MSLTPLAPSLESLELFVSVVELGSVSKAASLHNISQPSASARIQDLERLCKLTLLERTTHGSSVTEQGREIYILARETLESAKRLMTTADQLSNKKATRLKIYASYTIAEYLIPNWIASLKKSNEAFVPDLTVSNSQQVIHNVNFSGDLGFIESNEIDNDLERVAIGSDELWVVVGRNHAWTKHRKPITAAELCRWPLVLREHGSGTRDIFEQEMARVGYPELKIDAEIGSSSAIKSTLIYGTSAGVLSELVVQHEIAQSELIKVSVKDLNLKRSLYAVWSKAKGISYSERELIKIATKAEQVRSSTLTTKL